MGAFDAHMGGVGGQITDRTLVKIMGTSTCDMLVAPNGPVGGKCVTGICGQVDGSILPGMIGLEAGQSAFGDVYAWFRDLLSWPLEAVLPKTKGLKAAAAAKLAADIEDRLLDGLSSEAAKVDPAESTVLALDWLNGRRTPFADQTLKGAIAGLTLGSTAPKVFRALVEATAFGSKAIVEQFRKEGVPIALGDRPRRHREEEPVRHADHRGRARHADQGGGLRAGLRARGRRCSPRWRPGCTAPWPRRRSAWARASTGSSSPTPRRAAFYRKAYARYLELGAALERPAEEAVKTDAKRVRALREQVCRANLDLVAKGLVIETFGNVSGIDRDLGRGRHQAERRLLRRARCPRPSCSWTWRGSGSTGT